MQETDRFTVVQTEDVTEAMRWMTTDHTRPSMLIVYAATDTGVHMRVPAQYVPQLRAQDWGKSALANFDGNAGGAKDGCKGVGRTKRVDQEARDGIMRAAIETGRMYFNH